MGLIVYIASLLSPQTNLDSSHLNVVLSRYPIFQTAGYINVVDPAENVSRLDSHYVHHGHAGAC
jgi:hypothetical protein